MADLVPNSRCWKTINELDFLQPCRALQRECRRRLRFGHAVW
jgi:hypothetical protein